MVRLNVLGIPYKYWNLDFLKSIGDACGEFITVSKYTLNRKRLDVELILVSTSLDWIAFTLHFIVNGENILLKVLETFIVVELIDDDEADNSDEEGETDGVFSASLDLSVSAKDLDFQNLNLDNLDDPLSQVPDSLQIQEVNTANEFHADKEATDCSHNGLKLITQKKKLGPKKRKVISQGGIINSDHS